MDAALAAQIRERQEVLDAVRAMMIRQLNLRRAPDELDPDTGIFGTGLGLDSVDAVELVVSLESEFGIRLPDNTASVPAMRTLNTIVQLILDHRRESR